MLPDLVIVFTIVRLYPVIFTVLSVVSTGNFLSSLEETPLHNIESKHLYKKLLYCIAN